MNLRGIAEILRIANKMNTVILSDSSSGIRPDSAAAESETKNLQHTLEILRRSTPLRLIESLDE